MIQIQPDKKAMHFLIRQSRRAKKKKIPPPLKKKNLSQSQPGAHTHQRLYARRPMQALDGSSQLLRELTR